MLVRREELLTVVAPGLPVGGTLTGRVVLLLLAFFKETGPFPFVRLRCDDWF